jgi:hypothetical protein
MEKLLLIPLTAYKVGSVELWDARRIAIEYGVSKAKVRDWQLAEGFPKPYAVSEGGKTFYELNRVRAWAEDEADLVAKTLDKKRRGVGRPSQNRDLVKANRV